ncbi:MAG: TonB-dependent receptor [Candidatus Marinimicrobia bacterium]|nr:TonB-dependent receptor [Candidatus Neomarinimicrobiota bacterium]
MSKTHIFKIVTVLLVLQIVVLFAQTTGKISGKVTDSKTGDVLIGTNIIIEDLSTGAATDGNGDYFIINLPPGNYNVKASMIGYEPMIIQNVRVSVNRTSYVNFELEQGMVQGEAVVVEAQKINTKRDQTSTVKNVSSEVMDLLPAEDMGSIVSMQAGVVNGHFRGGRTTEVSYMIDGMQVDDSFSGQGRAVEVETEAISDLEVITGTFNAEYGKAMSGIVNAVTKSGSNEFHGGFSGALSNYFTRNDDIFIGLDAGKLDRNKDFKINLSGPIIKDHLHFFVNYRFRDNKNHLNALRLFEVDNLSDYTAENEFMWYTEQTGDSAYVPMDRDIMQSLMAKVSTRLFERFNLSLLYTVNVDEWRSYDHAFKYNPDGMASSHRNSSMLAFTLNQSLSQRLFYEFKYQKMMNESGWYVYENPTDARYVHDVYLTNYGPGFYTGGQQKGHSMRDMGQDNVKFDMTWQMTKNHKIKTGAQYVQHTLDNKYRNILNEFRNTEQESYYYWTVLDDGSLKRNFDSSYVPVTLPDSTVYSDIYMVKPLEFSAYFQDEISFGDLVMNVGLRYDYFDPATKVPTQWRNPDNALFFPLVDETGNPILDDNGNEIPDPERMSDYVDADIKTQLSPRLGLSYTLASTAVLHFSYGHFFQNPQMEAMYQNHSRLIPPSDFGTVLGNPNLKAEKTVQYEVGLWQQLNPYMDFDVALFYRDIYDLLSTKVISTYNQIQYGLFTNKDYGNVRGIELKFNMFWHYVTAMVNYTLQYTRGIADSPTQTFTRAGDNMDPIPVLIPMNWDQRHTFNLSLGYNTPKFGGTVITYYNSGTPYTWSPIEESVLSRVNLYNNNAWQPSGTSVDFNGYYNVKLPKGMNLQFTLAVYNVLDKLNENWVNGTTGRAYTAIVRETDLLSHRSNFNEYKDTYQNPAMYSAPRRIKLEMGINF